MKIAILTFQDAVNYGAILQAYALRSALQSTPYPCVASVLDYHCKKIMERHLPNHVEKKGNPIKGYLKMIKNYRVKSVRKQKFDRFKREYLTLVPYDTDAEKKRFLQEYDAIVVGSDQVWNLNLTGGDDTYFLSDFKTMKRFSYAASIGESELTEVQAAQFKPLADLDAISVREESAKRLLGEIIPNKVEVVPDPVLLLNQEEWRRIESEYKRIEPNSYVLLYHFNAGPSLIAFAKKKAAELGCKLVCIQGPGGTIAGTTVIRDASPDEFIWLIDHAKCVVTNSFHGTMFSVIFKKDFYTETHTNRSTRIVEALKEFRMESHMLYSGQPLNAGEDRNVSEKRVEEYRQKGLAFISTIKSLDAEKSSL